MTSSSDRKVRTQHLQRRACLYVRQSTLRQVAENTESTARQYSLRERAVALGWSPEHVDVIDCDLGQSGKSATGREGFQRLVADVSLGRVGIVLGLEVSRLARNCSDWHRLLEICALSGTLILDEDGIYDPAEFNDRLLLGLKGTMSEAELHVLRARLRGGILNKARRGDLRVRLPVGLLYDPLGRTVIDPDQQVQGSIRLLFSTFRQVGSAHRTVRCFREQGVRFPVRLHSGPCKGELAWRDLTSSRVLEVVHNPRYAGAFAFGRRTQRRANSLPQPLYLPRDQWHALVPNAHEGYISWEDYEENQRRLSDNTATACGNRRSPVREGPALLQGLAICARCGTRMSVRYHVRRGGLGPDYVCRTGKDSALPTCPSVPGEGIDAAIGELLLEVVTPVALDVTLSVQHQVQAQIDEADELRHHHVERHRHEAELARRRFMQVDSDNRLVAATLEADWNEKLRALEASREEYERRRQEDRLVIDESAKARIHALANDFPRLWRDPKTADRDRKRMVRLIIEDVTLRKEKDDIGIDVRFKGGATRSLRVPRPLAACEERRHDQQVVSLIAGLLEANADGEIASILNERHLVSGTGRPFDARRVGKIRRAYGLGTRQQQLRAAGLLTLEELAQRLGVSKWTVKNRRAAGTLPVRAHRIDDNNRFMYEDPGRTAVDQSGPIPVTTG